MKIGMIGTGRIAKRFVKESVFVPEAEINAVYNPHEGSAERFITDIREKNGIDISGAYTGFDEFIKSVDAVYIASIHETHYEYAKKALLGGKHVLCEKPLAFQKVQAKELFTLAKDRDLVFMEGLKTAYCPGFKKMMDVVSGGVIGDVKYVDACFTKLENSLNRELTDKEYGGSFTELGSYVLLPTLSILGTDHMKISFQSINDENTGLDIFTKVDITYGNNGPLASGTVGLGAKAEGRLMISGTRGYITVCAPWWKTAHFEVHFEDASKVVIYDEPFEGDGLRYELEYFIECSSGRKSNVPDERINDISIAMAGCMEAFLKERNSES